MEKVKLVSVFEEAMVDIYRRALSEAKYKAAVFYRWCKRKGA